MSFLNLFATQLGITKEQPEELKQTDKPIETEKHITSKEFNEIYSKMLTREMATKENLRLVIYIQTDKGTRFYTIKELLSHNNDTITFLDKNNLPMTFNYTSIVGVLAQK
jgi:hypothetical protein